MLTLPNSCHSERSEEPAVRRRHHCPLHPSRSGRARLQPCQYPPKKTRALAPEEPADRRVAHPSRPLRRGGTAARAQPPAAPAAKTPTPAPKPAASPPSPLSSPPPPPPNSPPH